MSKMEYVLNVIAAALGLVAYPAHGMMKSLYTATHSKRSKIVAQARIEEGKHLAEHSHKGLGKNRQTILRNFEAACRRTADSGSS
jgi:hypothetical protein